MELNNFFLILGIILIISIGFFYFYYFLIKLKYITNRDNYLIHKHILEEICENYKNSIYVPKLEELKRSHNLDENSQLNARSAFLKAKDNLDRSSAKDIYQKLSRHNLKCLQQYYSNDVLVLIIFNNLRS